MEKINFSVQLDPKLHEQINKNADEIGLPMTDYCRAIFRNEAKTKTIFKHFKKII